MKYLACAFLLAALLSLPFAYAEPSPINVADLQARAAQGDPEAELDLGRAYHLGTGVPKDFAKAADLYRKAATQGKAKAMYNLGYLYLHGQGVAMDNAAAAQWFQKSADAGLLAGQLWVGLAYYNGDSVLKQDYGAALKWLKLAAEQQTGSAVDQGKADNALGYMYCSGVGVALDVKEGLSWYEKGAELGDGRAQFHLGGLYLHGADGVQKDMPRAYMWLRLACLKGEPLAMHTLTAEISAKHFTDQEIADGTRLSEDFERKHGSVPEQVPTPTAVDPMSPHQSPAGSAPAAAKPAATNASPAL